MLSALSQIVCMLLWVSLILNHRSAIQLHFSSRLITSNFSSVMDVFCQIFTWIALGDVDLCFLLVMSLHTCDWQQWCYFLLSSYRRCLLATDHLCQIVLNEKLLSKLKNKCKLSSCVKAKSHKKKSHKTRPACMLLHFKKQLTNSFITEQRGSCGNILTCVQKVLGWLHQLSLQFFF
jgi:hypothetical protein